VRQCIAASAFRIAFGLSLAALLALPLASPLSASDEFWAAVKKPGAIILLRHSYAPESPPDADLANLKNCSTQRNLDETGRAQARRIGDEFRKHGVKSARIHSSQYCRTLETGRLLNIGQVRELGVLNQTFFAQPFAMREGADKTLQFMKTLPARELAVLVTHVTNIQAIAGVNLASGEMAVVRLDPSGKVIVAGRLMVK
jgi:phosphohistidine phosphatase SixA